MVSKSREEQLQEWKSRRTVKPLNKICPNVLVKDSGRVSKPLSKNYGNNALGGTRKVARVDKENSSQGLKDKGAGSISHGKNKDVNHSKSVDGSTQRWLGDIQGDWNQLSEQLDVLKRQTVRSSILRSAEDFQMVPASLNTSGPSLLGSQFSLPRDSLALAPSPNGPVFEPITAVEGQNLMALADQLFTEAAFVELCERGMNARLQRTKDGATAESRINELAGLVKLLRRCLSQLNTRTRTFIDAASKFERDVLFQVEAIKLSNQSSLRQLEAELASAKRDAAQAAASHKAATAVWVSDMDVLKAEVGHLKREIDRIEAERDRARGDLRRFEAAKVEAETVAQELKKEASQQVKDLQKDHSELLESLKSTREAASREQRRLQGELETALRRAEHAEAKADTAGSSVSQSCQEVERLSGALQIAQDQLRKVELDRDQLSAAYTSHQEMHDTILKEKSSCAGGV
eukprot:jgi/Botrbrau1/7600/Bobra.0159s0049.1